MKGKKGFTLIESVISVFLTVIAMTILIQVMQGQLFSFEQINRDMDGMNGIRYPMTILEKQIANSDNIYFMNGVMYLKDLESPSFYNYYSLGTGMLYKNKTDAKLATIGLGSLSQFASNITGFKAFLIDNRTIQISLSSQIDGKAYSAVKEIRAKSKIYVID
ncbi:MAG: hypothetical protein HGA49_09110 [Eubacteriaceae bacterium]|nr:hypothetical protein [Eubacteriaceae bacterium]